METRSSKYDSDCPAPSDRSSKSVVDSTGCLSSTGYDFQMFKTLELNNFKCFRSLKLDGLKRVNVIAGANATGKSSLLEAIVCGARATPDALIMTNTARGIVFGPQNSFLDFPLQ